MRREFKKIKKSKEINIDILEISKEEFKKYCIDENNIESGSLDELKKNIPVYDHFNFDEHSNLENNEVDYRYFKYDNECYKWTFEYDEICEVTNEHTIYYFKNIFEKIIVKQ